VDDFHLTVHGNLMTHLKRGRDAASALELAPLAVRDGVLETDVVHLATIGLPPLNATPEPDGRFQKVYQGGNVIIPVIADRQYSFGTSHLLVDLWATRPGFKLPGKLPAIVDGARAATTVHASAAVGPLEAGWAFRTGVAPPAEFWFRLWFATVHEAAGRPFFWSAPKARFQADALDNFVSPRFERWEVNGFRSYVMFKIGHYEQRMSPAAARDLAGAMQRDLENDQDGKIAIPFLNATAALPNSEATQIARFLVSSADYADGVDV
jgi:hypothetical protein